MLQPAALQTALSSLAMGVRCWPADTGDKADDMGFLRDAHASTRAQDLALLSVDPAMLQALVQMQFEAQRQHYVHHYPGSMPWVIAHQGRPVGHMWLHHDDHGLRLMDIAVLPAHRGLGVAGVCMRALMAVAQEQGCPVHLHVRADNPIRHWYARLGFATTGTSGLHLAMTFSHAVEDPRYEQA